MKYGKNRKEVTVVRTQDCMMQNISRKEKKKQASKTKQTKHNKNKNKTDLKKK